jgi:hypothetical protein
MNKWFFPVLISLSIVVQWNYADASRALDSTSSPLLSFEVTYVYRTAGVGELKTIKNGDTLKSGDHYKIVFIPHKDCYVYIFQVDSSGQIFQLFPMESFQGVLVNNFNPAKPDRTYILPSPDKAFVLDSVVGVERIYFIASDGRDEQLEGLYGDLKKTLNRSKSSESGDTRSKLNKYFRRRGIKVVPSEQNMEVPWKETGDLFSVMGQRLENLSSDSLHVIEFVHK